MNFNVLSRMKNAVTRSSFSVCVRGILPHVCLTLFAASANAGTLKTEMQFVLPKSEMIRQALQQKGAMTFSRESLTFSSEFPVELKNIDMKFNYSVKSLVPGSGGNFTTGVELTNVVITVKEFKIDTVIEMESSGVKARIPIKAICQNLKIQNQMPVEFQLKGQVTDAPALGLAVTGVDWKRVSGVWKIEGDSCQAANGFMSFLNEQLTKLWMNSGDLPHYIFQDVNIELGAWFTQNLNVVKDIAELDSRVKLSGHGFQDLENAWVFGIEMQIEPGISSEQQCATLKTDIQVPTIAQAATSLKSEIWINEKVVDVWAQCLHERGFLKRQDRAQEISGFRTLMSSRFLQFFVWSDLMRFDKNTDFYFMTSTYGNLKLTPVATTSGVQYGLQTNIASRMMYPEGGRWAKYLTFYTPLNAKLQMSVSDSKLQMKLSGAPRTNLAYRFDVANIWNQNIGVSTIESEVKSFLQEETFAIELPVLQIGTDIQVKAMGLRRENKTLKLRLERVTAP